MERVMPLGTARPAEEVSRHRGPLAGTHPHQRGRRETNDSGSNEIGATGKYKSKVCIFWLQPGGCPYGFRCMFAHGVADMSSVSTSVIPGTVARQGSTLLADGRPRGYKTQTCKFWVDSGGLHCPHGVRCTYSHGRDDEGSCDDRSGPTATLSEPERRALGLPPRLTPAMLAMGPARPHEGGGREGGGQHRGVPVRAKHRERQCARPRAAPAAPPRTKSPPSSRRLPMPEQPSSTANISRDSPQAETVARVLLHGLGPQGLLHHAASTQRHNSDECEDDWSLSSVYGAVVACTNTSTVRASSNAACDMTSGTHSPSQSSDTALFELSSSDSDPAVDASSSFSSASCPSLSPMHTWPARGLPNCSPKRDGGGAVLHAEMKRLAWPTSRSPIPTIPSSRHMPGRTTTNGGAYGYGWERERADISAMIRPDPPIPTSGIRRPPNFPTHSGTANCTPTMGAQAPNEPALSPPAVFDGVGLPTSQTHQHWTQLLSPTGRKYFSRLTW